MWRRREGRVRPAGAGVVGEVVFNPRGSCRHRHRWRRYWRHPALVAAPATAVIRPCTNTPTRPSSSNYYYYYYYYRQDAAKRQTAGIKSTHRPKISLISPRRGDSLHRFTSNLAGPTAPGSASLCKISPQSAQGVGMRPPKYQKKNPLFDNESPRRGDPLDRFLNFRAFIRLTPH